jgi:[acyl-carrier-protein] S-malonyltransferase
VTTLAFVFPGQGAQAVGMGRAFYEASAAAKAVFEDANAALGEELTRLIFEGPEAELMLTRNTQPAILTVSVAAAAACAERGLRPAFASGHSLGEYSALAVAGALPFADAVRLVRRRGEFMQEAVPVGTGAMAAIMGLGLADVEAVCREAAAGEVVEVANVNSPAQIVIAGHRTAVERAAALATTRGGKRTFLPVSAPFHCSLMAPAAERLSEVLKAIEVRDPRIPVARNADAGLTRAAADVKPFLVRQVASPVRWSDGVRTLVAAGVTAFVEVGPGRTLTGLLKRIADDVAGHAVNDPDGLDKVMAALGRAG